MPSPKAWHLGFLWGVATILYLAFGLSATGWLFYELTHLLNVTALYPLYSVFRGVDYYLSLQPLQIWIYLCAGLLVGIMVYGFSSRKNSNR